MVKELSQPKSSRRAYRTGNLTAGAVRVILDMFFLHNQNALTIAYTAHAALPRFAAVVKCKVNNAWENRDLDNKIKAQLQTLVVEFNRDKNAPAHGRLQLGLCLKMKYHPSGGWIIMVYTITHRPHPGC